MQRLDSCSRLTLGGHSLAEDYSKVFWGVCVCLCSPQHSPQHNSQGGSDFVDALSALLLLQALPSSALWGIGWLLLQVFGLGKAGQNPYHELHKLHPLGSGHLLLFGPISE